MSDGAPLRIACVQHGDYAAASAARGRGEPESYSGQYYSMQAFERFVGAVPCRVVDLGAPRGTVPHGTMELCGLGSFRLPLVPRRIQAWLRAQLVLRLLREFRPTHLLLRCDDVIGVAILAWAIRRGIDTAVVLASRFRPEHAPCRRFVELANHRSVRWVANHNRVATQSLVDCGLQPAKAIAYDFLGSVAPDAFAARSAPPPAARTIVYAGAVIEAKGVPELVAAVAMLRAAQPTVRLVVLGDGAWRSQLLAHEGVRDGWIHAPGRVANEAVRREMRAAWLVVVPTRHAYPEALPFVITESLAVRTPVVLSDHPIFRAYFGASAAVRFARQGDPAALAQVFQALWADDAAYQSLSAATAATWQSLQVETKFHHLLQRLAGEWGLAGAP